MKQMINLFVKGMAGLLAAVALLDVGTTSMFLFHQPDLPEELGRK